MRARAILSGECERSSSHILWRCHYPQNRSCCWQTVSTSSIYWMVRESGRERRREGTTKICYYHIICNTLRHKPTANRQAEITHHAYQQQYHPHVVCVCLCLCALCVFDRIVWKTLNDKSKTPLSDSCKQISLYSMNNEHEQPGNIFFCFLGGTRCVDNHFFYMASEYACVSDLSSQQ